MFDKCNSCKNKKDYGTGTDEYPPFTIIEYCREGHWSTGDYLMPDEILEIENCLDYNKINETT
jgi:hypothetical protein